MQHDTIIPSDPALEQRRNQRHVNVMMIGRVRGTRGEFACVVQDISPHGMRARFPYPPKVGDQLTIGLRDLPELGAVVRWVKGASAGVEFNQAIDLAVIIGRGDTMWSPRAPRFACGRSASLMLDGRGHAVALLDVSLGGAKLTLHRQTADLMGRGGMLLLPQLNALRAGAICWVGDDQVGFRFSVPLALDQLAGILDDPPASHEHQPGSSTPDSTTPGSSTTSG